MSTLQCPDCGSWFERMMSNRRRCRTCAAIRAQQQQRAWQRTHRRREVPESTATVERLLQAAEAHVKATKPFTIDPHQQRSRPEYL